MEVAEGSSGAYAMARSGPGETDGSSPGGGIVPSSAWRFAEGVTRESRDAWARRAATA